MNFHWSQAVAWILAATGLIYGMVKDRSKTAKETEDRLRALEVKSITDDMEHKHQMELMKMQVASALAATNHTQTLIETALKA